MPTLAYCCISLNYTVLMFHGSVRASNDRDTMVGDTIVRMHSSHFQLSSIVLFCLTIQQKQVFSQAS